jgi:hypothetical protein
MIIGERIENSNLFAVRPGWNDAEQSWTLPDGANETSKLAREAKQDKM